MATGVIESISKTSLVVTTSDKATITLTGKAVEVFAPNSKLGDSVDYTLDQDGVTVTKIAKTKVGAAPAARTNATSPNEKMKMSDISAGVYGSESKSSW